ncbi:hypothetical protein QRX50_41020 [Amycolatopsis carbonis]|uniref:Uncharacterized protein n=1 Tax=Amycolatopsis carbonis TaxID=715471 RepID=A0A9Y2MUD5_9PSEU|nr:hypothetical protein [Amycolatopsis sp. 2-15]WIX77723.1 hypothetical protein QRX50_41020 [Amycolatopsis sp. 2-15]
MDTTHALTTADGVATLRACVGPGVDDPRLPAAVTLSALGEALTAGNVAHLGKVELRDIDLFAAAMTERDPPADAVTGRAVAGAGGLVELMRTLTK